jgi:hypothetical protein
MQSSVWTQEEGQLLAEDQEMGCGGGLVTPCDGLIMIVNLID